MHLLITEYNILCTTNNATSSFVADEMVEQALLCSRLNTQEKKLVYHYILKMYCKHNIMYSRYGYTTCSTPKVLAEDKIAAYQRQHLTEILKIYR